MTFFPYFLCTISTALFSREEKIILFGKEPLLILLNIIPCVIIVLNLHILFVSVISTSQWYVILLLHVYSLHFISLITKLLLSIEKTPYELKIRN